MAKLKLDDLGTDIKALIVENVLRPSDLKNVCLVNRAFHEIAVKALYRHVPLDLGSDKDLRLSAFLSPKNIGLKHIRHVRLYLANERDRDKSSEAQEQQASLVAKMILEFLPEDTLEEFRCGHTKAWCPWTPFSAENLMLLYRKQRKMKWLEVMDLDRDILPELKKNEKLQREMFQSVRRLALYPENRETLRLCQFYVQKVAEVLEDLTIHTNFHEYHDPRDPSPHDDFVEARELNDSATAPGLLTRTTFSHMMPFDKCEPLKNLKYLRLHKVNLRYCADTWCKIMDFTKIEHLRVYQCAGADSLFGELSKARSLPKQLKSLEVQHKDNHENETLLALDGFLCLVSGIRELIIDLENVRELPAVAGIVRHGKTLELLNVHGSDYCSSTSITSGPDCADELVYDREDFEKICKACTSLEQLSCAWPFTSLIRVPSEDWKAYERACSGLKEMVTLHISTWPSSTKPSTQRLPRSIYQHLLQGLAQRVFETAESNSNSHSNNPFLIHAEDDSSDAGDTTDPPPSGPSKLHLIAFGISDKIYERVDSKNQILYLRSTCQDAEGRSKAYAAPISWCLRQYIVPHSDILDFVLHREARPPCSLETGFGWNGADDDDYLDD